MMTSKNNGDFNVSVFDVHSGNLQLIWPCLVCAIQNSSFVALDCELSGIGTKKLINSQAVDDRYKNIAQVAKTRSIISIGVSCYKIETPPADEEKKSQLTCNVQTFNLMALCSEEYTVEPNALQFLVNHGFDFQKQYGQGIPYHRGNDKEPVKKSKQAVWNLRDMFTVLVSSKVPIILHNGLVDLVFLYHSLYAELPPNLSTFISDLEMMFPKGVYDTKYIAEFSLRMTASFLEFVFRTQQFRNLKRESLKEGHVKCNHWLMDCDFVDVWDCSPRFREDDSSAICQTYIGHGFCSNEPDCLKSHDVFRAVVLEERKKSKKRKQKDSSQNVMDSDFIFQSPASSAREEHFKGHRAGHDAFMTGFCFASFLAQKVMTGSKELRSSPHQCWAEAVSEVRNRVCLSGKDFPLLIQKSGFAKCSKSHLEKYSRIVPE